MLSHTSILYYRGFSIYFMQFNSSKVCRRNQNVPVNVGSYLNGLGYCTAAVGCVAYGLYVHVLLEVAAHRNI
jgi:hypothetical protein